MTLRHMLADVRLFFSFALSLLGLAILFHGAAMEEWLMGAMVAGVGMSSLFLVWLAAQAGETSR